MATSVPCRLFSFKMADGLPVVLLSQPVEPSSWRKDSECRLRPTQHQSKATPLCCSLSHSQGHSAVRAIAVTTHSHRHFPQLHCTRSQWGLRSAVYQAPRQDHHRFNVLWRQALFSDGKIGAERGTSATQNHSACGYREPEDQVPEVLTLFSRC